ncbi:AHH domain-containing protein [Mucilaginibacter sp. BJC16-A38]|uniref:DUF6443 domain-containing protein n=1 Tax=Mucilaginibacter phenanthrenivorans TaxID=1234842 RepID=UPI002158255B|nr:DUF6443 domain-containing protein [Mucilaginibacter phenanthrenivorans]MCR8559496.1 AHH domain-containing protein [Mucilaginibacter phenanthrenivorans]
MNKTCLTKSLKYLLATFISTALTGNCFGQLVLNQPNTSGNYTAPQSIRLDPGFSVTAGQSFSAKITPGCIPLATALSSNQNYIVTYTPKIAGLTNPADPNNTTCQVMATVQYYDGLGRPIQNIKVKGSPTFRDLVLPTAYDPFGRETIKYNPYTVLPTAPSDGSFKGNAITDQSSFYANPANVGTWNAPGVVQTPFPFAETGFEPSPLNRIVEQGAMGDNWQLTGKPGAISPGHTNKLDYVTNDAASLTSGSSRWAKLYSVALDANGKPTLVDGGSYDVNQLYVTVSKDENWKSTDGKAGTTEEYKDKEGRTILKRVFNTGGQIMSTYYVFDDLGNTSFVLPPNASPDNGGITQAKLNSLCYQYRFDARNRVIEKNLPGKGVEYLVYNALDLVVATQDSTERFNNTWAFTKYDALSRPVITGIWNNGGTAITRISLQNQVNNQTTQWEKRDNSDAVHKYYTANSFPTSNTITYLTVDYYDDYNVPSLPATYNKQASYSTMTRGLLTASLTNVLGTADMLWTAQYYDDLGRVTKTIEQHYLGGSLATANYDETGTSYDFTNNVIATHRNHNTATNPVLTISDSLVYDHVNRKTEAWNQVNSNPRILMAKNDYNEIGQLRTKHLNGINGNSSFLQDIAYTYNERGWMTKDSSRLFVLQLKYNDGTTPQFNGNIANQYWGTGSNLTKNYTYSYDKLNRILSGVSSEGFTEQAITYDLSGNIQGMTRLDPRVPATYTIGYAYNGNQLTTVSGLAATGNYLYDGNGNASFDALNNVKISYNVLNLPQNITGSKTITYTYDAAGNKLRRVSSNAAVGTDDYIKGIQYHNNAVNFILTSEGKAVRNPATGAYSYEYTLDDQLGNSRVYFDDSTNVARVIQKDDYYPFGLNYNRYTFGVANTYLYNKKELQQELTQYDYGARFYDPVLGRFTSIDPLAEHFPWMTSYQYGSNNPTSKRDLDGLEGVFFFEETGVTFEPVAESIAKAGGEVAKRGVEDTPAPKEDHHVVPKASKANDFVKDARDGGFKFEGEENKIKLDKYSKASGEGEHGNHPEYNKEMDKKIDALKENNPDASPSEKANLLRNLVKDVKDVINNNRGVKTNDLFKPKAAAQDAVKNVVPVVVPPQPPKKGSNEIGWI